MDISERYDDWGPEKVLRVYDPKTGMQGFTVIDNTALGPGKGGIRMTSNVSVEEVARLARAMTWKNSLADLPFGGGKSGIIWDKRDKKQFKMKDDFIRAFSRAIKQECPEQYVSAPDINTSEREMQIFVKENGNFNSATGKPLKVCQKVNGKKSCGLPHELGSTGFGVSYATQEALKHKNLDLKGASIAIQGFGNVGTFTFKSLEEDGAKVVAVSDSKGVLYNPDGLSYKDVMKVKAKTRSVVNGKGRKLDSKKIFELPVDVLIPAAQPDVINKNNVGKIKAKVIVEAANIPMRLDIEKKLSKRILIVPDFVANAGGVISSYAEYIGKDSDYMQKLVKKKLTKNTHLVLNTAMKKNISPRQAAMKIATDRVRKAMIKRDKKN